MLQGEARIGPQREERVVCHPQLHLRARIRDDRVAFDHVHAAQDHEDPGAALDARAARHEIDASHALGARRRGEEPESEEQQQRAA